MGLVKSVRIWGDTSFNAKASSIRSRRQSPNSYQTLASAVRSMIEPLEIRTMLSATAAETLYYNPDPSASNVIPSDQRLDYTYPNQFLSGTIAGTPVLWGWGTNRDFPVPWPTTPGILSITYEEYFQYDDSENPPPPTGSGSSGLYKDVGPAQSVTVIGSITNAPLIPNDSSYGNPYNFNSWFVASVSLSGEQVAWATDNGPGSDDLPHGVPPDADDDPWGYMYDGNYLQLPITDILVTFTPDAAATSPCSCLSSDPVRYVDGTLDYQSSDLTFADGSPAQVRTWTNDQQILSDYNGSGINNGLGTIDTELPTLSVLPSNVTYNYGEIDGIGFANNYVDDGSGNIVDQALPTQATEVGGVGVMIPVVPAYSYPFVQNGYPTGILQQVRITLSGSEQMTFVTQSPDPIDFSDFDLTSDTLPYQYVLNALGQYEKAPVSATYVNQFTADTLNYNPDPGTNGVMWSWHQIGGDILNFNSNGELVSSTSPGSPKQTVVVWSGGQIADLAETDNNGNGIVSQIGDQRVEYQFAGNLLSAAILQSADDTGGWITVRQVSYTYYTAGSQFGNAGDLELATVSDALGDPIDTSYYRYYTANTYSSSGNFIGYADGLEYVFGPAAYAALKTAALAGNSGYTALDWPNADAQAYADHYYQYNVNQQVTLQTVAGFGASENEGQGTFTYSYTPEGGDPNDPNAIYEQTTETLPNGGQNIVDCDGFGLSTELISSGPLATTRTTYYTYDGYGRLLTQTMPSGLIEGYNYSDMSVNGGKLEGTYLQNGSGGTVVPQESYTYIANTANSQTTYWPLTDTVYRDDAGDEPETTTYSYDFNADGTVHSVTTYAPAITAAQDGPFPVGYTGLGLPSKVVYDNYGHTEWTMDADGYVNYYQSDPVTGGILKEIQDIDAATIAADGLSTAFGATGWSLPQGTHLDLTTLYTIDALGRTTSEISPDGNVTYYTYNDPDHQTRIYPGWHEIGTTGQYTSTGPIEVSTDDEADSYTETLSYSTTLNQAVPDGSDPIVNLQSLSRKYENTAGQVTSMAQYFNLSGVSYATQPILGSATGNYYLTSYGYDSGGNQDRVQSPNGTITRTVYDGFDEPVSIWVGAVVNGVADDTVGGEWSLGNTEQMTEVSAEAYDGDGNEIESVQYPEDDQPGRATEMYYNWRDQLVAEMTGGVDWSTEPNGGAAPDTAAKNDTFYSFYTVNNLGEVTGTETYNAEGNAAMQIGGDLAWAPSAGMRLTAASFTHYDNQGRLYEVDPVPVDPATNTMNFFAVDSTYTYYDADGNIIASIGPTAAPTGTATKYTYDGAGRLTASYSTDGGTLNNYSNAFFGSNTAYAAAASVSGDVVGSQTEYVYDGDSNVIETITSDRLSTVSIYATTPGSLQNGNPVLGGVPARVSYSASYYDAADRDIADVNVGTNANTQWTRPASVPARSAGALVTSTVYDAAGNVEFVTDPNDLTTAYGYDALGRTVVQVANWTAGTTASGTSSVSTTSLPTPTNSANQTTEYSYDGDNNVTSETAVTPAGQANQTTTYVYGVTKAQESSVDDNDLLYKVEYPDPTTGGLTGAGWTFNGDSAVAGNHSPFTYGNPTAPQGNQVGVLQTTGSISQTVAFAAGTYSLSFLAAQRAYYSAQNFEVLVDGSVVGTFTPSGTSYATYATSSFTVAAGMHTITFQGLDTGGGDRTAFIDNVQISDASGTTATPPVLGDAGFESPAVGNGNFEYTPAAPVPSGETYTYDATGAQTGYTDRNGTVHAYVYDQLGRLTSDTINVFGSNVDQTVKTLSYSYDDAGNRSTATSSNADGGVLNQVVNTYDGFGQLISDAQAHSGTVSAATPTVGYSRTLFAADDLSAITYPDGRVIKYNYDGTGAAGTLLGQIMSVSDSSGILQSYTYLGLDTPVTFTDGNGVELSYLQAGSNSSSPSSITGLDPFGRVLSQNWTNSSGATIDDPQYQYDGDGNVLSESNTTAGGQNNIHENQTFTYDGLNRLTGSTSIRSLTNIGTNASAGTTSTTQSWNLDALGNWNSSTTNGQTTSRANNSENQIQSLTTPANTTATLGYDANGNTTQDQNGQQYVYDAWNRLVAVKNSAGATIATYAYDAEGRQIQITESGTTTDLYYSNRWQVLEERQNGEPTKQNVWSPFYVDTLIESDLNPTMPPDGVDTTFGTGGSETSTVTPTAAVVAAATAAGYTSSSVSISPRFGQASVVEDAGHYFLGISIFVNGGYLQGVIECFNADGSLDTSFNGTGVLMPAGWQGVTAMAVQSNGDILVGVETSGSGEHIARIHPDGSLDSSFGSNGVATIAIGSLDVGAITQRSDGEILVAGSNYFDFTLSLLTASGSIDSSFGTDASTGNGYGTAGTTTITFDDDDDDFLYFVRTLLVLPSGNILVSGGLAAGLGVEEFNPNGSVDTSFGDEGSAGPDLNVMINSAGATATAVTSTGQIIEVGNDGYDLTIVELNPDGSLDTSFAGSGIATITSAGFGPVTGIMLQSDGNFVVGGTTISASGDNLFIAKILSTGELDSTFGISGIVYGPAAGSGLVAATPGGQWMIFGQNLSRTSLVLARFNIAPSSQRLYAEQDADGNVISISDSSGNVLERYAYDDYGNVTVLNADGSVRGNGTAASSLYGWVYLHQGLRLDVVTGLYYDRFRQTYDPAIGRFLQQDPTETAYVNGANLYQDLGGNPVTRQDSSGLNYTNEPFPGQGGGGGDIQPGQGFDSGGPDWEGRSDGPGGDTGPYELGWEWLWDTSDPTDLHFNGNDKFTQMLEQGPGAAKARAAVLAQLNNATNGCPSASPKTGTVSYAGGMGQFLKDYLWNIPLGKTGLGDPYSAFVGGYIINYNIKSINERGHVALVHFHGENTSGLESLTHLPNHYGPDSSYLANTEIGPGRTRSQTFDWDESISFTPAQPRPYKK